MEINIEELKDKMEERGYIVHSSVRIRGEESEINFLTNPCMRNVPVININVKLIGNYAGNYTATYLLEKSISRLCTPVMGNIMDDKTFNLHVGKLIEQAMKFSWISE